MRKVTLIEGDGIGPEITWAIKEIFLAAQVPIEWEEENAGQTTLTQKGELIPETLVESIKKNKIALKGPITTPVGKGFKSINVQLRQMFDLYQNLRPCKTTKGIKTRFEQVDIVLFRENTEGLYSGLELFDERLGMADSVARVTKKGCDRIIRAAFEYARKNNRKKVTLVHKANILKSVGRIFLECGEAISKDYPEIIYDEKIIDNMCMQMVIKPEQFDVIVATNLFGDILSDLGAGLVGGLGVVAGANIGDETAIFEAVHGTAPDIAGKGIANPTALLRSAILMLNYMGLNEYGQKIDHALEVTLADKKACTGDLGGKAGTKEFTEAVISHL
ncbi:isocitrate/isopropylmalate dehydrogenase family protein [Xanthovirga aplysinae]|uniref:isocitrate/isopropylmalate dehydrogenase family protein n=1 Tax=Xanthovirga aplysinae TaxID=2529853 RepID=UPI0012BB8E06|nr:isocitrate/isopropylmalate family dehydrogenase [Xanthovirga aplysinae]MTI33357.1 NAD-dependent isocitrate dehydrogenase [Xanthovirga aplysinae]